MGKLRKIDIGGNCPLCGKPIDLAIVSYAPDRNSPFWGEAGKRFLICHEGAHNHIQVESPAGPSSRYAYMVPFSRPPGK